MKACFAMCCLILSHFLPSRSHGQQSSQDGIRVLVKTPVFVSNKVYIESYNMRVTGHLQKLTDDTLHLNADGRIYPVAIPVSSIKKVKVSKGHKKKYATYFAVGVVVGALSFGLPYASMEVDDLDPKDPFLIGAGFGGLGGLIAGLLDGNRERWQKIDISTFRKLGNKVN